MPVFRVPCSYATGRAMIHDNDARSGARTGAAAESTLHIVLVIDSLGGGGAERVMADLAHHLACFGHKVTLVTLKGDVKDVYQLDTSIERVRVEIRSESRNPIGRAYFLARRLGRIRRSILERKPDVVVSFIDKTNVYVLGALAGSGVPIVVSERIHPGYQPFSKVWTLARTALYRRAAVLVVQTADIARWSSDKLKVRCVVTIPNAAREFPTPVRVDSESDREPCLIVAAGRLTQQKGFDLLLEAFAQSKLSQSGWRLVIAGEGDQRAHLEELILSLGLTDAVSLPGFVHDVDGLMRRAEIFVLSSRYEGFPNVLIEAMQLGVAAISFDCPSGPRDLIEDGVNGILVAREDVGALSAALRQLSDAPDLRRMIGQNAARTVAERLSPAAVYGTWDELLRSVVASNARYS